MRTETELRELLGDTKNCKVFMDRSTMGLTVNISLAKIKKEEILILEAETNACHKIVEIEADNLLHAFYHPCVYVADPHELFPKSKSL